MKYDDGLSQDKVLLQQLTQTVLNNLDNEQFGVEDLSAQIGISRSHLHRKLKLLKGKSVSQFIREVRLEEAMKLLHNNVATTSEIAYRVGFNSPSYFHKCFHKHYGYPPGEVKNRVMNELQDLETETNLLEGTSSTPGPYQQINSQPLTSHPSHSRLSIQKSGWFLGIDLLGVFLAGYFFYPGKQTHTSIAVLPLHNFTGDLEQEYFVKGLHDALIGALEIWKTSYAAKGDHKAIEALLVGEQRGDYQGALENLAQMLIARSDTIYVTPWQIGTLYTRAGRKDEALIWLEKAYEAHDSNMPYISVDPIFDVLRDEIRFQSLLERMNLPLAEHPLVNL